MSRFNVFTIWNPGCSTALHYLGAHPLLAYKRNKTSSRQCFQPTNSPNNKTIPQYTSRRFTDNLPICWIDAVGFPPLKQHSTSCVDNSTPFAASAHYHQFLLSSCSVPPIATESGILFNNISFQYPWLVNLLLLRLYQFLTAF